MIFGIFTLIVALIISGIAAYYSIIGLTAIFSTAVIPIIIMGAALEVGKITAAVWLKVHWSRAGVAYKLYLVPAVAVLMLLTSMGIFGYLSKAHSDQSLSTSNADARITIIDEKIRTEKELIDVNRKALKQLDEQVDQVMVRSKDERGAERSAQIRRNQQRERAKLQQDIEASQKRILILNEERAPIAAEFRKIESEVGPIKYIAALVYDENPDITVLEKAVRLVIIIIVAVFDPLALVLILAAQQSIRWSREDRRKQKLALLEKPVETLQDEKGIVSADKNIVNNDDNKDTIIEPAPAPPVDTFNINDHPYLKKPWAKPSTLKPMVAEPTVSEPIRSVEPENPKTEPEVIEQTNTTEQPKSNGPLEAMELRRGHGQVPVEAAERPNKKKVPAVDLTADNDSKTGNEVKAHFGLNFPVSPEKGELYLRVDYLPSKLFKYNGTKWIEVDKNLTDSYVYNIEYIKYLIDEVDQGRIDPDDLSNTERNQISEYLSKNEQGRNPA